MFSGEQGKLRGDMTAIFRCWNGWHVENGASLFSFASEDRIRWILISKNKILQDWKELPDGKSGLTMEWIPLKGGRLYLL